MKRCLALLGLLVTVLATAGVAQGDIFTAPVYLRPPDWLYCFLTNISTSNLTVLIEIKDPFGSTLTQAQRTLRPGDSSVTLSLGSSPSGNWYRCKFIGATLLKARAYGLVFNSDLQAWTVSVPAE